MFFVFSDLNYDSIFLFSAAEGRLVVYDILMKQLFEMKKNVEDREVHVSIHLCTYDPASGGSFIIVTVDFEEAETPSSAYSQATVKHLVEHKFVLSLCIKPISFS